MNVIFQRMVRGLAALLASVLITACGAHSTNQSTETFTVYEDAPKMSCLISARREIVWAMSIIFLLRYIQSAAAR
jgi:hypothetical protein